MIKDIKYNNVSLNPSADPDPTAPFSVKKTDKYGLQIANLIAREWFNGAGNCITRTKTSG